MLVTKSPPPARPYPETGHDVTAVTAGICAGIERSFNATTYAPQCSERIAEYAREARGLRMQHEER